MRTPARSDAHWLFDPAAVQAIVVARRPAGTDAVGCVVSDRVWSDVVGLLRWAHSAERSGPSVASGAWWRLAADCAALLRTLPGLMDELDEGLVDVPVTLPDDAAPAERVRAVAAELTALLRSPEEVPLTVVSDLVGRLGSAAISASAGAADWNALR